MSTKKNNLERSTLWVILASAVLVAVAFFVGGVELGLGALLGAAVGVANFLAVRWVGKKILTANDQGKLIYGTLLVVKMGAILGVVWLLLAFTGASPIGFAIGFSGLVVGLLVSAFTSALEGADGDSPSVEEN